MVLWKHETLRWCYTAQYFCVYTCSKLRKKITSKKLLYLDYEAKDLDVWQNQNRLSCHWQFNKGKKFSDTWKEAWVEMRLPTVCYANIDSVIEPILATISHKQQNIDRRWQGLASLVSSRSSGSLVCLPVKLYWLQKLSASIFDWSIFFFLHKNSTRAFEGWIIYFGQVFEISLNSISKRLQLLLLYSSS